MSEVLPVEVEALVLAELAKRIKTRTAITKALVADHYKEGDKQTFRSPVDGTRLGSIYRSDPDPEWRITDNEVLHAHLRQWPGNLETAVEIADEQAAIDVLREHAPHLLVEIERVRVDVVADALQESKENDEAAAPGIERVKPGGVLSVRPDKNAGEAIERMVQAGVISWDGTPALEAGEQAS